MPRKKLTDRQKARRKANRVRFWGLHLELTMKADRAGANGFYDACSEYRKEAQTAFDKFIENGGRY